jgi:hypothetical protein
MPGGASGGGGAGGAYVFADLDHLDRVIGRWQTLHDDIVADSHVVRRAIRILAPPADDTPSVTQAKAATDSLTNGHAHNQAMADYARKYIQKLKATRTQYATAEQNSIDAIRNADPYQ